MTAKLEDFLNPTFAGFRYHEESILLEDAVFPLLIGLAKIAPRHGLPDSEMVELPCMGFHRNDEITQALAVRQLSEHQCKKLIPTGIAFYILIAIILSYKIVEVISVHKLD